MPLRALPVFFTTFALHEIGSNGRTRFLYVAQRLDAMRQVRDPDLALRAQSQKFGRCGCAQGKVEQGRSVNFGVDQGFAFGHGAGERVPSTVNVSIDVSGLGRRRKRRAWAGRVID